MQDCLEEASTSHPGPTLLSGPTVTAQVISWDTWQEHSGVADPRLWAVESSPHSVSLQTGQECLTFHSAF